jgi:2-oxoglutarate dehydrogenase E1 component
MNESLKVPTATTFRELPVAVLESRRKALNEAIKAAGRAEKVSFTHLIGYALALAAGKHPVMGTSYQEADGQPVRIIPDQVNLGLAVDVERKDGSRGLVVPVIRGADRMDFAEFHRTYEELVDKARGNKLMPDAFAGASMSLTNPGGLGTVASVPRLMPGQGSIIAVGAIGLPAEFAKASAERMRELGIVKIMTITSTYDHRVIQGAESGEFLRTLDGLLQGNDGFYQAVFTSFGLAAPAADPAPAVMARPTASADRVERRSTENLAHVAAAMALVKAHRTFGHLAAHLDPLGSEPIGDPALDPERLGLTPEIMATIPASVLRVFCQGETLAEAYPNLRAIYCGTIAYEVEHISSHAVRVWLREMIETGAHRTPLAPDAKKKLLARLTQVRYSSASSTRPTWARSGSRSKDWTSWCRCSISRSSRQRNPGRGRSCWEWLTGGRLNVLVHVVGKPEQSIIAEFEGSRAQADSDDPHDSTGDVKYHHGAHGAYHTATGRAVTVTLVPNPSHLEFVGPVVDGRARAIQTQRRGREAIHDASVALPVVIHGDAAFAGQGVVQEMLNLGSLDGYRTGGTYHLIANNQVGFTTDTRDARSTRHASDLAKGFDIPIIHVNADDPEACLAAVRLAMAFREKFHEDPIIDLVGYRRHGHNEADEPTYTQPQMYSRIKDHRTVRELYAAALAGEGVVAVEEAQAMYDAEYQRLVDIQQSFKATLAQSGPPESPKPQRSTTGMDVETAVPAELLRALNDQLLTWPEGFTVNPKLARQLEAPARRPGCRGRHRLGPRRSARLCLAGQRRHPDPAHRAGHRARHLQPAAPGAARWEYRRHRHPDEAAAGSHGAVRGLQQPAVRAGAAGL